MFPRNRALSSTFQCALFVLAGCLQDAEMVENNFNREAHIHTILCSAAMPHINICPLLDAIVTRKAFYAVFPLIEGAFQQDALA